MSDNSTLLTNFRFALTGTLQESPEVFDDRDIKRLQEDDQFALTFLNHSQGNLETAVQLVKTCLLWRKTERIWDLSSASFSQKMLENDGLYFHSTDREGHPILYMRIKDHVKSVEYVEEVKRYVIWLLERQHRANPALQVVVLFDLSGAGLRNMDLDQIKFIITCFQTYYPNYLARLLVYELPFVLNAAWKIIQAWLLEAARKKVTFAQRKDIQEYIEPSKLWVHMGGSDNYKHMYTVEENTFSVSSELDSLGDSFSIADNAESLDSSTRKRQFSNRSSSQESSGPNKKTITSKSSSGGLNGSMNIRDRAARNQENSFTGRFLTVCPADHLVFKTRSQPTISEAAACSESISLTNNQDQPVIFKIKTTSPTDFRIRPSAGIIPTGGSVDIEVHFRPVRPPIYAGGDSGSSPCPPLSPPPAQVGGNGGNRTSDKIQILALPTPKNMSMSEALLLLKSTPKEAVMEHRLSCRFSMDGEEILSGEVTLESISKNLAKMQEKMNHMEASLELLTFFLKTLIVLVIVAVIATTFRINLR